MPISTREGTHALSVVLCTVSKSVYFQRRVEDMEYPVGHVIKRNILYPYMMLAPLSPLVFQTRGKKEPCDGFGNRWDCQQISHGLLVMARY